jgi:hypothetical protein
LGAAQVAGGIEAIATSEGPEQRPDVPTSDYNGDGDYFDTQLRFYEHATRTIVTTNLSMFDGGPSSSSSQRFHGISDGEIIAYAVGPYPGTAPQDIEIRFIRVAPCSGAPCDDAEHCYNDEVFDGTACADGDLCNGDETCQAGACTSGTPVDCADASACTTDACVEGVCQYVYNTDPCNDGNGCTADDTCFEGGCFGSPITAPPDVTGVALQPDRATVTWTSVTYATSYDAVRGNVSALPVGPGGGDEHCFNDLTSPSLFDNTPLPPGGIVWYLVRGENSCGVGTFGTESNGFPHATGTCE